MLPPNDGAFNSSFKSYLRQKVIAFLYSYRIGLTWANLCLHIVQSLSQQDKMASIIIKRCYERCGIWSYSASSMRELISQEQAKPLNVDNADICRTHVTVLMDTVEEEQRAVREAREIESQAIAARYSRLHTDHAVVLTSEDSLTRAAFGRKINDLGKLTKPDLLKDLAGEDFKWGNDKLQDENGKSRTKNTLTDLVHEHLLQMHPIAVDALQRFSVPPVPVVLTVFSDTPAPSADL